MLRSALEIVAAISVLFVIVATVVAIRQYSAARRYLASTIAGGAGRSSARYACGVRVQRPGRVAHEYPTCELAVSPRALVVFGPRGRRIAELRKGPPHLINLRHRFLWELGLRTPRSEVTLDFGDDAARAVTAWMQRHPSVPRGEPSSHRAISVDQRSSVRPG